MTVPQEAAMGGTATPFYCSERVDANGFKSRCARWRTRETEADGVAIDIESQ
jgi:hypothetical protein